MSVLGGCLHVRVCRVSVLGGASVPCVGAGMPARVSVPCVGAGWMHARVSVPCVGAGWMPACVSVPCVGAW